MTDMSLLLRRIEAHAYALAAVGIHGTKTDFPAMVGEHISVLMADLEALTRQLAEEMQRQYGCTQSHKGYQSAPKPRRTRPPGKL